MSASVNDLAAYIFEKKEDLPDEMYRQIMNKIGLIHTVKANEPRFYKVWYVYPKLYKDHESGLIVSMLTKHKIVKLTEAKYQIIYDYIIDHGCFTSTHSLEIFDEIFEYDNALDIPDIIYNDETVYINGLNVGVRYCTHNIHVTKIQWA